MILSKLSSAAQVLLLIALLHLRPSRSTRSISREKKTLLPCCSIMPGAVRRKIYIMHVPRHSLVVSLAFQPTVFFFVHKLIDSPWLPLMESSIKDLEPIESVIILLSQLSQPTKRTKMKSTVSQSLLVFLSTVIFKLML